MRGKDKIGVRCTFRIYLEEGRKRIKAEEKDVITDAGLEHAVKLLAGIEMKPFKYIAVGTGTTPESETDTELENEIARTMATAEYTQLAEVGISAKFSWDIDTEISEAGLFNASENGVMFARVVFPKLVVPANIYAVVEFEISLERA
ncbi:MAG: hypothetical protein QIT33_gp16 [Methanophagales virus PBV300]|uniref:Uncharacterized protein n=1 Tax=Methanophagales virus PBV300 TaxID=2987731 RepID=A0ABY6GM31_9VIRU|nr:MAG: hypothetical protein QIT33_gp16 [Methanophagales virus PBV300]UYL64978.1 MAG: hypothetical protein JBCDKDKM_00016 [Methanophagales virus PBV300]